MGSFHQIAFGAACVGGAFWLGHYLNNNPDPDEVTRALAQQVTPPPQESNFSLLAPGATIGQLPKYQKPALPDPVLAAESELPPPSQLDPAAPSQRTAAQEVLSPDKGREQSDRPERMAIDVPDFSQLAATFRNTPLELPPLPGSTSPTPGRSNHEQRDQTDPAMTQSTQINSQPLSTRAEFSEQDFAPRLKDRLNEIGSRRLKSVEAPSATVAVGESVLESSEESAINNGIAANELTENGARPLNGVVSLIDQLNLNSRLETNSDPAPPSVDKALAMPQLPNSDEANRELQASEFRRLAKPLVPFGLTDTEKSKLVRLHKPIDRQIKLGTSKFNDYVTQVGDTLQELSTKYYGRPDYYLDIYLANQNQLRNPGEVPAGLTLKIPVYE